MKLKRIVWIFATLLLVSSLFLAACGSGAEPAADEPAADEPAADEPAADEPAADEPAEVSIFDMDPAEIEGTVTYWGWMPRPDTQFPFLLEAWEAKYPNIELNYERLKKVDHLVRLKTAMLGGDIADVIAINLGSDAAPYADSLVPLADYAEMSWGAGWEEDFKDLAIDWSNDYGDDYRFMPFGLTAQPMIVYDANLLREVGAEVPETYEEILEVLAMFEGHESVLPYVGSGLVPASKAIEVFYTLCEQIEPGAVLAASEGERSWTDPVFEKALMNYQRLFDDGFFPEDAFAVSLYPDITYDSFVNEVKFPMIMAGSFFMGEVVPSAKEVRGITDRRFGVIPFPNLEGGDPIILTGVDQVLAIPKNAKNKELAWLFIEFMATDFQPITAQLMEIFPAKVGLGLDASVMTNDDERQTAEVLSALIESNASTPGAARVAIEYPELTQAIGDGIASFILGGDSAADTLAVIQQASESVDRE